MKQTIIGLVFGIFVLTSIPFSAYASDDPCQDPKYLEMKVQDVDSMSERKYQDYQRLDSACIMYKSQRSMQADVTKNWFTYYALYALGSLAVVLLIL